MSLEGEAEWTALEDEVLKRLCNEKGVHTQPTYLPVGGWVEFSADYKKRVAQRMLQDGKTERMPHRSPWHCMKRYFHLLTALKASRGSSAVGPSGTGPARWSEEETQRLVEAVGRYGHGQWTAIARVVRTRDAKACLQRYNHQLGGGDSRLVKGSWNTDEDSRLLKAVTEFQREDGSVEWSRVADQVPSRSSQQCRERYVNVLDPRIRKGQWTSEEEDTLVEAVKVKGEMWSQVEHYFCEKMGFRRTAKPCKRKWKVLKSRWDEHKKILDTTVRRARESGIPVGNSVLAEAASLLGKAELEVFWLQCPVYRFFISMSLQVPVERLENARKRLLELLG